MLACFGLKRLTDVVVSNTHHSFYSVEAAFLFFVGRYAEYNITEDPTLLMLL